MDKYVALLDIFKRNFFFFVKDFQQIHRNTSIARKTTTKTTTTT
jgi:hypothetical protein